MHKPGTQFAQDRWQLFNLSNDPTEIHNLVEQDPGKLRKMQDLWESQAKKYGALPLTESPFDDEGVSQAISGRQTQLPGHS